MRFFMLRRRLRYSIGGMIAIGLFAALVSWQHTVANSPTTADEQLSNEVEVNVPRVLRVAGRHAYSIKVTINSKSEEPLPGPIYLVVQGTGVEALTADNADATTAADEPFFRFLSEADTLLPGKSSISRTIRFKSDGALRSRERRQFKLDYRLTRHVAMAKEEAANRDRRPRRSRGVGSPGGRGSRTGERSSRNGDKVSEDDPDSKSDRDAGGRVKKARQEPFVPKPEITDKQVKRVMKIQEAWTPKLMKTAGVRGTATGVNAKGELVIRVYTSRHGIAKNLPKTIEGIPVEPRVVGRFRSLFQPPPDKRGNAGRPRLRIPLDSTVLDIDPPVVDDPQQRFDRPVPIGVSGFNSNVMGCFIGTIGCRVKAADGTLYALSNNHVFANENDGIIGDPILQPGCGDNNGVVNLGDSIGTLAAFVPIVFDEPLANNRVDAALARVTAATLGNSTPRGAYGTPSSSTVEALLGMKVQKMGRSTSHTTGRISGINVAVDVDYDAGTGSFVGQIEIINPQERINEETGEITTHLEEFSMEGDSGSLIVTTYGLSPVCLLFAGSGLVTIANPIDVVLKGLGPRVGQTLTIDGSP